MREAWARGPVTGIADLGDLPAQRSAVTFTLWWCVLKYYRLPCVLLLLAKM